MRAWELFGVWEWAGIAVFAVIILAIVFTALRSAYRILRAVVAVVCWPFRAFRRVRRPPSAAPEEFDAALQWITHDPPERRLIRRLARRWQDAQDGRNAAAQVAGETVTLSRRLCGEWQVLGVYSRDQIREMADCYEEGDI